MKAAAEDRDAAGVVAHLAEGFRGEGGMGRAETANELRRYFALYQGVEVLLSDIQVERSVEATAVRLRADFAGHLRPIGGLDGLLPRAATYRFELALAPEGGRWRVVRAAWRRDDSE